jgi:hypothetical protein
MATNISEEMDKLEQEAKVHVQQQLKNRFHPDNQDETADIE